MGSNYKLTYNVDMVFCIDSTMSMYNLIDIVKNNAINFYNDVTKKMEEKEKHISQLRVRLISFRDYIADGENAMKVTDFFTLPQQSEDFSECVSLLEADGGGDDPEDGLEALAYAIKSKWDTSGVKNRQVIVLWTDDDAHQIGYGRSSKFYPAKMPSDIAGLTEWWNNSQFIKKDAKRLILYAPDMPVWNSIRENWDNVIHAHSQAGQGLKEVDYETILDVIANSI